MARWLDTCPFVLYAPCSIDDDKIRHRSKDICELGVPVQVNARTMRSGPVSTSHSRSSDARFSFFIHVLAAYDRQVQHTMVSKFTRLVIALVYQRFNSSTAGTVSQLVRMVDYHRADDIQAGPRSSSFRGCTIAIDRGYTQYGVLHTLLSLGSGVLATCKRHT